MAQAELAKGAVKIMESVEAANAAVSAQEIILDGTNKVSFPGYPYTFEALGDQILVSVDVFKSGYECKTCKGKKRIKYECHCITDGCAGKRYSEKEIDDLRKEMGDTVADTRAAMSCIECGGDPASVAVDKVCPNCKGIGATLVLPDNSKNLPTTGVVVSMGAEARAKAAYKIGDRILFGAYAGKGIPTKVGLMFKYMDWNLGVIKIEGAEDMAAFDFILQAD